MSAEKPRCGTRKGLAINTDQPVGRHDASWKINPSVIRDPVCRVDTPWRTGPTAQPRLDNTGRSRVVITSPCPCGIEIAVSRD